MDRIKQLLSGKQLVFILLLASLLRLWNFNFDPYTEGMPFTHDATHKLKQAIEVSGGYTEPHRDGQIYFKQPYFIIYSSAAILKLFGKTDMSDFDHLWNLHALYPIIFSIMTVFVLYHLALLVFKDRNTALIAALLISVVPIDVIGSRYFKEDVPLMFFTNLALLGMVRLIATRSKINYLLTGTAVGLAIATKYAAAMLIPFLIAAHIISIVRSDNRKDIKEYLSPFFFVSFACITLTFLAFNPYVLIRWGDFSKELLGQLRYSKGGHSGTAITAFDHWWCFYLRYAIIPGVSASVTILALIGIIGTVVKKNIAAIFIAAWAVYFYIAMESSPAKPFPFFARYIHALIPALCMFAAYSISAMFRWGNTNNLLKSCVILAATIIVMIPLFRTSLINSSLPGDTRLKATSWINSNLEKGSLIAVDSPVYGPRPSQERFTVLNKWRLYDTALSSLKKQGVDYVVVNNFKYDRFDYCKDNTTSAKRAYKYYQKLFSSFKLVKEIKPSYKWQQYGFHNPSIKIYLVPKKTP